jgi:cyclopropane fatty-acyl-phospholipid synthase-like methyltransferase
VNAPEPNRPISFRTDYFAHDAEYRKRRERGYPGWDGDVKSLQESRTNIEEFLSDSDLPPNATVLEFGCGAGDLLLPWAVKGHPVFGIDISPYAIEWTRTKARDSGLHVNLFVADITQELHLPIPPVDLIIDGHCLHCIIGPDRPMFFSNARNHLKPGGLLHINTMCGNPRSDPCLKHYDPAHRCIVINGIAIRYFGRSEDILKEITTAGFKIEKHKVIPSQYEGDEDCLLVNARAVTTNI